MTTRGFVCRLGPALIAAFLGCAGGGADVERVTRPLGPTVFELVHPMGGAGGEPTTFNAFGAIYGFRVRSGEVVDRIELAYYVPSNPNNLFSPGDTLGTFGPVGGEGGQDSGWVFCPAGKAAVGFAGRHDDTRVVKFGLLCASPEPGVADNPVETAQFGGTRGRAYNQDPKCSDVSPIDEEGEPITIIGVVSGLIIQHGDQVDQIRGFCRETWRFPG